MRQSFHLSPGYTQTSISNSSMLLLNVPSNQEVLCHTSKVTHREAIELDLDLLQSPAYSPNLLFGNYHLVSASRKVAFKLKSSSGDWLIETSDLKVWDFLRKGQTLHVQGQSPGGSFELLNNRAGHADIFSVQSRLPAVIRRYKVSIHQSAGDHTLAEKWQLTVSMHCCCCQCLPYRKHVCSHPYSQIKTWPMQYMATQGRYIHLAVLTGAQQVTLLLNCVDIIYNW